VPRKRAGIGVVMEFGRVGFGHGDSVCCRV
jgi:hypothetical protein